MCAMAANRKLRIVETQSRAPPESGSSTLVGITTCAMILAFGTLWFEFFRNLATLPKALMFWHFHF
jgi:hypothetical protein